MTDAPTLCLYVAKEACPFFTNIHEWQDLIGAVIGGVMGVGAALYVVNYTLKEERRKQDQETADLKLALGAEVRQVGAAALNSFNRMLRRWGSSRGYAYRELVRDVRFPPLLVATSAGLRLGALGGAAHSLVVFCSQLALVERTVSQFTISLPEDSEVVVAEIEIARIMDELLDVAVSAGRLFSPFPGSVHPNEDQRFSEAVIEAAAKWSLQQPQVIKILKLEGGFFFDIPQPVAVKRKSLPEIFRSLLVMLRRSARRT